MLAAHAQDADEAPPPRRRLRTAPDTADDFVTVMPDNLAKAGVQNTNKGERLTFAAIRPWPGGREARWR